MFPSENFPSSSPTVNSVVPTSFQLCVHELFEQQVVRRPDAIAVSFADQTLTYAELNERANRLARYLKTRGLGREALAAIFMERSLDMVTVVLAVLKAGGAYLPLDPAYPKDRISHILDDSGCQLLITNSNLLPNIPISEAEILELDSCWQKIAEFPQGNLEETTSPENLAYVIYTSGSTGKPKGVQVEHRNVVNFLHSMQKQPGMSPNDAVAALTTLCFDIAGLEIHLPLSIGARIVMISRDDATDGTKLRRRIEGGGVTVMQATPATWRLLLEAGWPGDANLKILCGGEAFPGELAAQLLPRCKSLWNMYGPTETTIWSAVYEVKRAEPNIPIGMPIDNTHFHIVDDNMRPVAPGNEGQLLIGGHGVARGYVNRPELTDEKFVPDAFGCENGARVYKTGDLARLLPDGNLVFLGRLDHQVKIRGFRIELGEVEYVLANNPAVKECVVAAREDLPGDQRLVAYIVPSHAHKPEAGDIRQHLGKTLPEYMVPTLLVTLDALPLTANGKVDRKALPRPTRQNSLVAHEYVAPRNALEQKLVGIWEGTLGVKPIGITDNIFDLGIDSIVAAQLFARIGKVLGRELPPAPLFQAPTIEKFACLLRDTERQASQAFTSLVEIQPSGTQTPLFCVHGAAGTVLGFYPLAQRLAPERPVYGFQSQGLYGHQLPHTTFEKMASHYVSEMRRVQPHGPYLLSGWCSGGIIAFEMAQQLHRVGEKIELLAMFNAPSSPEYARVQFTPELAPLPERAQKRWNEFKALSFPEKLSFAKRKAIGQIAWRSTNLRNRSARMIWLRSNSVKRRIFRYYLGHKRPIPGLLRNSFFLWVNARAERGYKHQPYEGEMIVFRDQANYPDPSQGWSRFVHNIEVCEIPVSSHDHRALLKEPAVALLADKLRELSRAKTRVAVRLQKAA